MRKILIGLQFAFALLLTIPLQVGSAARPNWDKKVDIDWKEVNLKTALKDIHKLFGLSSASVPNFGDWYEDPVHKTAGYRDKESFLEESHPVTLKGKFDIDSVLKELEKHTHWSLKLDKASRRIAVEARHVEVDIGKKKEIELGARCVIGAEFYAPEHDLLLKGSTDKQSAKIVMTRIRPAPHKPHSMVVPVAEHVVIGPFDQGKIEISVPSSKNYPAEWKRISIRIVPMAHKAESRNQAKE